MKDRAKTLIEKIGKERGLVKPWNNILARYDPEFMETWHNLDMKSLVREGGLSRKEKEIISIVVNAVTYHEDGVRLHMRTALEMGVTAAEIIDALEVCTMLGVHYISAHVEFYEDEVSKFKGEKEPIERPQRDPEFMEHWRNVSAHALRTQRALSRKVKELICVVIDALTYFEPGLRRHVKAALEQGATEQEVFQALELCSVSGVQYMSRHLGILQEEVKNIKR